MPYFSPLMIIPISNSLFKSSCWTFSLNKMRYILVFNSALSPSLPPRSVFIVLFVIDSVFSLVGGIGAKSRLSMKLWVLVSVYWSWCYDFSFVYPGFIFSCLHYRHILCSWNHGSFLLYRTNSFSPSSLRRTWVNPHLLYRCQILLGNAHSLQL